MDDHKEQHLMYRSLPNLIIGFHGCDQSVCDAVINQRKELKPSTNDYDRLGNGIYFWEQNLERAWQWAEDSAKNPRSRIKPPAVIGAVIDLGNCLNLLDSSAIELLKQQYDIYRLESELNRVPMKQNKNIKGNSDLLMRNLDCAVIESLHDVYDTMQELPFDSVRGMFFEGKEIYETSGFREKSHIQICVRNPNCIKGLFLPMKIDEKWRIP